MASAVDLDFSAVLAGDLFLVMLFVLKFVLIDPYLKIVEAREQSTEGARDGADDLQRKAQETLLQYEERLASARKEAMDLRTSLRDAAEAKRDEQVASARAEAEAHLATQRAKIDEQTKAADAAIEREAQALSQTIISRVLNTGA